MMSLIKITHSLLLCIDLYSESCVHTDPAKSIMGHNSCPHGDWANGEDNSLVTQLGNR